MSTGFIDFENPNNKLDKCEIIVLDTCSMINLASGFQNAIDFANFTLNNDIMLCYTVKSVEELHIMKEGRIIPKDKRIASLNMRTYIAQSDFQVSQILNTINLLDNMYGEPIGHIDSETWKQTRINADTHKLRWGDAMIYTIAKQNNLNHIWTYDQDWSNVIDDDMNILTQQKFVPGNGTVINLPNNTSSNVINNASNVSK